MNKEFRMKLIKDISECESAILLTIDSVKEGISIGEHIHLENIEHKEAALQNLSSLVAKLLNKRKEKIERR